MKFLIRGRAPALYRFWKIAPTTILRSPRFRLDVRLSREAKGVGTKLTRLVLDTRDVCIIIIGQTTFRKLRNEVRLKLKLLNIVYFALAYAGRLCQSLFPELVQLSGIFANYQC